MIYSREYKGEPRVGSSDSRTNSGASEIGVQPNVGLLNLAQDDQSVLLFPSLRLSLSITPGRVESLL